MKYSSYETLLAKLSPNLAGKVRRVLAEMKALLAGLTTEEKILLLYQCVTMEGGYDYTYKKALSYCFLGALKGTACCSGYAELMVLLISFCCEGECKILTVTGYTVPDWSMVPHLTGPEKMGHAWNMVTLGSGKSYHMDVTWDLGKTREQFRWCLVSDREMTNRCIDGTPPASPERYRNKIPCHNTILLKLRALYRTLPQCLTPSA